MKDSSSEIWRRASGDPRTLNNWNHESEIENFVKSVFLDIADLIELREKITITHQLSLTKHLIPDILFLEMNGILIGVCEVKRPSSKESHDDFKDLNINLQNQITNYLLQLKYMHGVQTPIGIITTYNEWKICFLKESYDYVLSDVSSELFIQLEEIKVNDIEEETTTLYTSKIYTYYNTELIEVLAATIHKMYYSKVVPPTSMIRLAGSDSRKFGFVNKTNFVWKALPSNIELKYTMPTAKTKNFYFIQDFYGGKDGHVWLTMSAAGNLAVCKLSRNVSYKEEAKFWKIIWGCTSVYTTTLSKVNALVMPFVFHGYVDKTNRKVVFRPFGHKWSSRNYSCTIDDIIKSEIPGEFDDSLQKYYDDPMLAAKDALAAMAEKGFRHGDLAWRHVGLLPYPLRRKRKIIKWGVKPVLIDLHDTMRLSGDASGMIEEGLKLLQEELNA